MESIFKLIVHDADVVVPDTGIHTASNVSNGDANSIGIILAGVCLTIVVGIIALSIIKRKKACAGLVAAVLIAGLAIATPIMSANAAKRDIDFSVAETVTATIDREKGETYVVVPVDITLNEATDNGYELYMYGGDLTDGTNTITQVSADGSKITEGTWGIVAGADSTPAIDDEVWNQIGTSSSPKKVSIADGEIAAGTTIRVYYGVSIDDSTPAGDYTTTIGFLTEEDLGMTLEESYENAGAEKITVGSSSYYTMQSMTPEICEQAVESELQVADSRDEKIYWIAKLKDGKCWMTQNLDLDLVHTENDADALYTHENTDLGWEEGSTATSWNPSYSTIPASSISSSGSVVDIEQYCYNQEYDIHEGGYCSLDVGDWYWTDAWYESTENNYLDTADSGAGDKFRQTPYPGNGAHGHVGNYYGGDAATAESWQRYSADSSDSICPAGWKLPMIDIYEGWRDPEYSDYYKLFSEYTHIDPDWLEGTTDVEITSAPLYFIRAGMYDLTYGEQWSNKLDWAGHTGYYWTQLSIQDTQISSDSVVIWDYGGYDSSVGMSVRCLAR
ncbi:DUF4179 domain-containing protein [Candidatus Saccharibacteria bacterium]|nr:DUF4179 domain-containing protein [Candidatus Saccharibacteria bacterium]